MRSGFAGIVSDVRDSTEHSTPIIWLADYFGTYVERDLRQLLNVRDLQTFRTFVRMCAARTSQVLRDAEIANVPFMASADGMQC